MKQVERVDQVRRLAPSQLLFIRQDKGVNQIALAESIAEDSETEQSERGDQVLSPSSSLHLPQ